MFTSGAPSKALMPRSQYHAWFTSPALGPPSSTQAKAPRKGGVTKDARIIIRRNRLPGRSVRDTSHAIGAAQARQIAPTAADVQSVVQNGFRNSGSATR